MTSSVTLGIQVLGTSGLSSTVKQKDVVIEKDDN